MATRAETRRDYEEIVRRIVEGIATGLDRTLCLPELAREAYLSPFHFHRVFTAIAGESPLELQRRLRLERAASQLRADSRQIVEIAFDAGYATHEAFTKAFGAAFGLSPSEHRRNEHGVPLLAAANGVHYSPGGQCRFVPRELGGQLMKIDIRSLPAMQVACIRHIGPYNQIGGAFQRLMGWAYPAGAVAGPAIAIYHDDPGTVPPAELRSDACVVIRDGVQSSVEGVSVQEIPANEYAVATHVGPYEQLGDAWARFLSEWFPQSGRTFGEGPCFERYLNDCTRVPASELITELCQPVSPL